MSQIEDSQGWLGEMMAKIIEKLGLDVDTARYDIFKSMELIMSTVYFIRLQFKNKTNSQNEDFSIVLKRPSRLSDLGRVVLQFQNEILFYQMYIRPDEKHLYARCYYVDAAPSDSCRPVIALENVNERGYYSCPYTYNVPLGYTLAAMRELGRFHAKGYAMKDLQREKFNDIVARLQEVRYVKMESMYKIVYNFQATRGVEYLRRQGHDAAFCDKMEAVLANGFDEVMMKVVKPLEPLSTLCHGDFILNNLLFKTDGDGQYRAMLIDFALIRYSTPVVDLSTYFCLCYTNERRKEEFSDIMLAYHDALTEYLLDAGVPNIERYSYNALLDDFRRGALFGFILASMFLPVTLGYLKLDVLVQEYLSLGGLEATKKQKYAGGDEVCKILADMLLDLRDFGCLKHIL